jgi:multicomponent Na+:H+ antiporter subunit E
LGVYRLHPLALFRFFLYFGWQSVRGGLQVALMAVASKERIQPHFFVFTTRLPPGTARVVFANAISLMPGTLTWMLEEELVHIHVLNDDEDVEADLRRLEMKIASIFGLTLERDA